MKQKGKAIQLQQGAVTDLISYLANLPEREKSPDDLVSLPEIFRRKDYVTEIRSALKKGYKFEDLSKIFTEKCGVPISVRQLKYHYTRGKNKPQRERPTSPKPPQKENSGDDEGGVVMTKLADKKTCNGVEISPIKDTVMDSKAAKSGTFVINMEQEEI